MKKGDIVMTLLGEKEIIKVKKDVVIFDDGFAPKDRVIPITKEFPIELARKMIKFI